MSIAKIAKKGEASFPELLRDFKKKLSDEVGAIGSFIGIVRCEAKKEGKVKQLHFECSDKVTKQLEKIATRIENIEGISKVAIHHIIDDLEPGEEILYVLVAGKHRAEIFKALPRIIDQIKEEVDIWMKEITEKDEYWVHEI